MPFVYCGVELYSRVRTSPSGVGNFVPELFSIHSSTWDSIPSFFRSSVSFRPEVEVPLIPRLHSIHERVRDSDRIVAVLTGYRRVGLALPISI